MHRHHERVSLVWKVEKLVFALGFNFEPDATRKGTHPERGKYLLPSMDPLNKVVIIIKIWAKQKNLEYSALQSFLFTRGNEYILDGAWQPLILPGSK